MIKCLIALIAILPIAVSAQTIWTWVDENGQRHYSDTEVPGATPFEIGETQTFSGSALTGGRSPATSRTTTPATRAREQTTPASASFYTRLEVVSPEAEETVRNIGGNLSLSFAITPVLGTGHRVDVVLDGARRNLNTRTSPVTVPEVFRGEHTATLVVIDSAGTVVQRSEPVRFYVMQTSVITSPAARGRGSQ